MSITWKGVDWQIGRELAKRAKDENWNHLEWIGVYQWGGGYSGGGQGEGSPVEGVERQSVIQSP